MIRTKSLLIMLAVLAWLTVVPLPAAAEWFAELYGGVAITPKKDVTVTELGVQVVFEDVEFDTSASFGGRGGYWFETWPDVAWGLALDVFHFRPNVDTQTVTATALGMSIPGVVVDAFDNSVTVISFDLMLRGELLKSSEFPRGQLLPYLAAGPGIFVAEVEDTINFGPPFNQSDTDTRVGVQVGAGLAWLFTQNFGLFAEYRFTYASPEFEFNDAGVPAAVDIDLNSHHILGGLSFRF